MNGKGSKRRKGDDAELYRQNYDRIFGNKENEVETEDQEHVCCGQCENCDCEE